MRSHAGMAKQMRGGDLRLVGTSQSASGSTAPPSPHTPKQPANKRKANELTSSGDSMEPATRRLAPGPLSGAGSAPFPAITAAGTSSEGAGSM
jgi:hypothetical protein